MSLPRQNQASCRWHRFFKMNNSPEGILTGSNDSREVLPAEGRPDDTHLSAGASTRNVEALCLLLCGKFPPNFVTFFSFFVLYLLRILHYRTSSDFYLFYGPRWICSDLDERYLSFLRVVIYISRVKAAYIQHRPSILETRELLCERSSSTREGSRVNTSRLKQWTSPDFITPIGSVDGNLSSMSF